MKGKNKIVCTTLAVVAAALSLLGVIGFAHHPATQQTMSIMSPPYGGSVDYLEIRYPSDGGTAQVRLTEYQLTPDGSRPAPPSGPSTEGKAEINGSTTEITFGSTHVMVRGHQARIQGGQIGNNGCRVWTLTTLQGFRNQVQQDNAALARSDDQLDAGCVL